MSCPSCGTEQPDDARFCGNCGEPLRDLSEGAPATVIRPFARWLAIAAGGGLLAGVLALAVLALLDSGQSAPAGNGVAPSPMATSGASATPTQETAVATSTANATPAATPAPSGAPESSPSPASSPAGSPTSSPTSVPPTATALPPTATSVPPTATAVPPSATPAPPTATPTKIPPTATATATTPALSVVSGTVYLYFEGEPLDICAGCRTQFAGPAGTQTATSGPSGGYSIQLPPGDYHLFYPCPSPLSGEFWVYIDSVTIAAGTSPALDIYRGFCY